jgi:hypothetical protein
MDLDIRRVIKSIPKKHEPEEPTQLMTTWGEQLAAQQDMIPLAEHPRPQMARQRVWVLNGWWQYAFEDCPDANLEWPFAKAPRRMDGKIRVPFSPEAVLSGVGRQLQPTELLWYRCRLSMPKLAEGDRCLLHFDGVDYACAVYLNGAQVGTHEGAYQPFYFDVTELMVAGATLLEVCVYDPSDTGTQLRGKQRLANGGMWYTAQSGIWQSVWLEVVPATHIQKMRIVADPDHESLVLSAWLQGEGVLSVDVLDAEGALVSQAELEPSEGMRVVTVTASVETPRLWCPDDPYLYRLRIRFGTDEIRSYCAFRTITVEKDELGIPRLCLNHEPFFFRGVLDQGYWPDGLMTPPSDEAIVADLTTVRNLGFNTVRKHIKVESERWYWHADRLGVLVWQDMPSGGTNPSDMYARNIPTLFKYSWHAYVDDDYNYKRFGAGDELYRQQWIENTSATVTRLSNHPSIAVWVLFNESWGQFEAAQVTQQVWELDPNRPVLSTSGWFDQGAGDIHGVHNYFRGMHLFRDPFAPKQQASRQSILEPFRDPFAPIQDDEESKQEDNKLSILDQVRRAFAPMQQEIKQAIQEQMESLRAAQSQQHGSRAQVISEMGGLLWHMDEHSMFSHSYGYAEFESEEDWLLALTVLLDKADLLENDGLSGFVYTQLSDVEEETNGLLTYDRKVCKLS